MVSFHGMILKPDGSQCFEASRRGTRGDATALGTDAGQELKKRGGPDFFLS
jgi:hydroxymethylbilane synthase